MREEGLEPTPLSGLEPKSSASANSATLASVAKTSVPQQTGQGQAEEGFGKGTRLSLSLGLWCSAHQLGDGFLGILILEEDGLDL